MARLVWSRWHTEACQGLTVLMFLGALGGWAYGLVAERRNERRRRPASRR